MNPIPWPVHSCKCDLHLTSRWRFPAPRCNLDMRCAHGGVCNEGYWGANCTCRPGFSGTRWDGHRWPLYIQHAVCWPLYNMQSLVEKMHIYWYARSTACSYIYHTIYTEWQAKSMMFHTTHIFIYIYLCMYVNVLMCFHIFAQPWEQCLVLISEI